MALTGQQLRQLQNAISSAYPSQRALERMLRFGMDVRLASIARDGSLADVIFEVLQWAEAQGRTAELLRAAITHNDGNALLTQVAADLGPRLAGGEGGPDPSGGAPAMVPVDRSRLRAAISQAFSASELELLCADVQEALAQRGVDLPVGVEEVGGTTKSTQVLNLILYLERRGYLLELVRAVRAARPGLLDPP